MQLFNVRRLVVLIDMHVWSRACITPSNHSQVISAAHDAHTTTTSRGRHVTPAAGLQEDELDVGAVVHGHNILCHGTQLAGGVTEIVT